jgi:DNA-directed RNA polymerase sigma subunit (sigma70/sigma32)
LRYGLESAVPLTHAAVGKHLGLTRERVRRIEQKALATVAGGVEQPLIFRTTL